jgi:uncharacterized protein (DUF1501 family)
MMNRRRFLQQTLQGSSLLGFGPLVPGFLAATARAAEPGKDRVLVVLEMTGGNDGLNTVIPYADDLYHRARPTIRYAKEQVLRVNDHVGLNPGLRSLEKLLSGGQVAAVLGVGYPNPDRSHFESMDIWQSADPTRKLRTGWLGRGLGSLHVEAGHIPAAYVGKEQLPLALHGAATGVPTIHRDKPYDLELTSDVAQGFYNGRRVVPQRPFPGEAMGSTGPETPKGVAERRRLIEDLARLAPDAADGLLPFVRRSALQTYTTISRLREIMEEDLKAERQGRRVYYPGNNGELARNLSLIGHMINAGFGTRVYYLALGGFDTHANQQQPHQQLLQELGDAVAGFYSQLERAGQAKRVLLMTFSEFGRRVDENGSRGTDHGAASCMFVIGPAVKGGAVGKHPSLAPADLLAGDLKHQCDFREVYATLLDGWLSCDSRNVLGGTFDHVPLLKS